jgi:hypothetical protein
MNLKNQPITFHPSRRPVGSLNAVIQGTILVAGSPEPGFTPSALHRVGRGKARGRVQPGSIVQETAAEIDQGIAAAARDDVDHPADAQPRQQHLRSESGTHTHIELNRRSLSDVARSWARWPLKDWPVLRLFWSRWRIASVAVMQR